MTLGITCTAYGAHALDQQYPTMRINNKMPGDMRFFCIMQTKRGNQPYSFCIPAARKITLKFVEARLISWACTIDSSTRKLPFRIAHPGQEHEKYRLKFFVAQNPDYKDQLLYTYNQAVYSLGTF